MVTTFDNGYECDLCFSRYRTLDEAMSCELDCQNMEERDEKLD